MDKDDIISTLNDLIETCKDGEEGFRTCAEDVRDMQLKTLFTDRARGCNEAALELQKIVVSLGGDPETKSSVSGALHRRWLDIKSAITGHDDHAILSECERGEDVAKRSYRNALDKVLPEEIRVVVERQYQGVLRNHDQVKSLRDQQQASRNLENR
jgi:uncharacterized protein (TIGR02284 family)